MAQLSPEQRWEVVRELSARRLTISDLCRKFHVTPRTLYRWRDRDRDKVAFWNPRDRLRNSRRPPKLRKKDAVAVLELALNRPVVGPARIAKAVLAGRKKPVGSTTVFKFLRQCKLNTYRRRVKAHHVWRALGREGQKQMITEILSKNWDKFSS